MNTLRIRPLLANIVFWMKNGFHWPSRLRTKMLLMVLALTALPFVFFTVLVLHKGTAYIYEHTEWHNHKQIDQLARLLNLTYLELASQARKHIQTQAHGLNTLGAAANDRLFFPQITLATEHGQAHDQLAGQPLPPEFRRLRPEDPWDPRARINIGQVEYFPAGKALAVPIRLTWLGSGSRESVFVTLRVKAEILSQHLAAWVHDEGAEIFLADQAGRVLVHPRLPAGHPVLRREAQAKTPPPRVGRFQSPAHLPARNDLGRPIFRLRAASPEAGLQVVLDQNADMLAQRVDRMRRILLIFLAGAMLFSLVGGMWFVSWLVGPLEELEAGIQLLESGLLAEPIPVRSQDEIGRLTQTFNQMAQSLIARNEEIRGKNRKLSFFNDITRILNQSIDLRTILDKSLLKIISLMHASSGWIHISDPHQKQLKLLCHTGLSDKMAAQLERLESPDNIIHKTFLTGKPVMIRDVAQHLDPMADAALERIRDLLLVPLLSKKTVLGVLAVGSRRKYFFHYQDLELLSRIGDELGIAVENALLYLELQLKIKELEAVNQDLQELDRFKTRILSNVSHELRTPITSIKTYIELFLADKIGPLSELQKEKLMIVQRNTNHLLNLINDLLTLARLQDQKNQSKPSEIFHLQEVVDYVIADTIEMARGKGLQLARRGAATPVLVRASRQKLQQVLQNLISNAIKFTDQGSITVHLNLLPSEQVEISVADTGIGIAKKDIDKIFKRFYQVDSSSTRKYVGTGLGLAIVKEILEAHESEIHVESTLGAGSRFWFSLPVVSIEALEQKAPEKNPLPPAPAV